MAGRSWLPVFVLAGVLFGSHSGRPLAQDAGTDYVAFWRGDLRVFATQPQTRVEVIDIDTGALVTGVPVVLADVGHALELSGGAERRVRVLASDAAGAGAIKPVVVWTGSIEPAFKHPTFPPSGTRNPWASYIPTVLSAGDVQGRELGRELIGFTTRDLYLFARVGPDPTRIDIEDLLTNVELDADDTQTLTPASPSLIHSDAEIEVYRVGGFEDDTLRIRSNVDVSVLAGYAPDTAQDWSASPPSYAAGDDGIELGTLFYTFVNRSLAVFPTQDATTVTITDLSDGDDSIAVVLDEGEVGDATYDLYTPVLDTVIGIGIAPRPSGPLVVIEDNDPNPFDNDLVKIASDKPVLVYVGPVGSDVSEFADVAFSVPIGPAERLAYVYAQNGAARDLQVFVFDPATQVQVTSLTRTLGFRTQTHHDFSLPPYTGPSIPSDVHYFASGIWDGELLRIESTAPIVVIGGDYDTPNFGAFVPFFRQDPELPPVAIATGPETACPGELVPLDGSASFDQDDLDGPLPERWEWDCDVAVDSDSNGVPDDDLDASGPMADCAFVSVGPHVARLTFFDDEGESDTDDVTITIVDEGPPVIETCPEDRMLDCTEAVPSDTATFSDDCGAPTVVFEEERVDGPCPQSYVLERTWSATDLAGNETLCEQTVSVADVTPPTITGVPEDEELECADDIPPPPDGCLDGRTARRIAGCVTADNAYDLYSGDREALALAPHGGDCAVTASEIRDGESHDFTTGGCYLYVVAWSDDGVAQGLLHDLNVDGVPAWPQDPLWEVFPTGRNFDGCTDTPPADLVADEIRRANAGGLWVPPALGAPNDGSFLFPIPCIEAGARWTWHDSGRSAGSGAPFLPGFDHDEFLIFRRPLGGEDGVAAEDDCDTEPSLVLDEERIDSSCPDDFVLRRTWTATDACGNVTVDSQDITVRDARPPRLQDVPADDTVECDAVPAPASPTADDDCDPDPVVSFVEERADGPCQDQYTLTRTWTATDRCGNETTGTQTLVVHDTRPPVLEGVPADDTVECDAVPAPASPTADDDCDPDPAVSFVEERADGPCQDQYTLTRTWTATDRCGNEATGTQALVVRDTRPPVLEEVPADDTVECDAVPAPASPTADDDCDPDPAVSFVEERADGPCQDQYTLTRTWTATDRCGNEATGTQTLVVHDTRPPVLEGVPADDTVECDAVPAPASPTADDDCDPDPVVSFVEERADGPCQDQHTLTRTWTATDRCGNETTGTQALVVHDTRPPVLEGVPADDTVECDAVPAPASPTADDDCDPDPAVSFVEERADGPCPDQYTLTRTWTATDRCGNEATGTQALVVHDTRPPVLDGVPADDTVECDAVPAPASPTADDDCDPDPAVSFVEERADGPCQDQYTLTRTWTATDRCGNEAAAVQTILVADSTPPEPTALLVPAAPLPPRSAASPRSACSPPSSRLFSVTCAATDNCDPSPGLAARLLVTLHDVVESLAGERECVERVDVVDVDCGELVEIRLVAPPCPAKPPRSPRPALSVTSEGLKIVFGEAVALVVTATDRCGNSGGDAFDPAAEPSTLCDEVLDDGTCCPAIAAPAPPDCKEPPCG